MRTIATRAFTKVRSIAAGAARSMVERAGSDLQRQTLELLSARQEIYSLMCLYCRGIDRFDLELVRSCYLPDAIDHHTGFDGNRDDFVSWLDTHLRPLGGTLHIIANHLADIDGDTARAETYVNAYHWPPLGIDDPSKVYVTGSRYVDRLSRTDGAWKITERWTVRSWIRSDASGFAVGDPSLGPVGQRGNLDYVYRLSAS